MSMLAATFLIFAAGATSAETPPNTPPSVPPAKSETAEAAQDPIICQRSTEIGSRLKRRKVCMHRSEWDRQKLEDRQMIDRTQIQRGLTPSG